MPKLITLATAGLTELLAFTTLMLGQVETPPVVAQQVIVVLESAKLSTWCVFGSMAGAFLSVFLFPSQGESKDVARKLALKFALALVGGFALTPLSIQTLMGIGWLSATWMNVDFLFGYSFLMAFASVSILHLFMARIETMYDAFVDGITGFLRGKRS